MEREHEMQELHLQCSSSIIDNIKKSVRFQVKKKSKVSEKLANLKSQISKEVSKEKKVYKKKRKEKDSERTMCNLNPESSFIHKWELSNVPTFHFIPSKKENKEMDCSIYDLKKNTIVSYIRMDDILPQNVCQTQDNTTMIVYKKTKHEKLEQEQTETQTEYEKLEQTSLTVFETKIYSENQDESRNTMVSNINSLVSTNTNNAIMESLQTKQNPDHHFQSLEHVDAGRVEGQVDLINEYNFLDDFGLHNDSFVDLNLEYCRKEEEKMKFESKQEKKLEKEIENKQNMTLDRMTDVLNSLTQLNRDILDREQTLRGLEEKMAFEKKHFEDEKYIFYQKSLELKYELERNRVMKQDLVKLDYEQKILVKEKECVQKLKHCLEIEKFKVATEKELIKKQFLSIQNILVTDNDLLFVVELNKSNISYKISLSDLNNVFKTLVTKENFSKIMNNFYRCFVNKSIMIFCENQTTYMLTYTPAINFKFMILVIQAEKYILGQESEFEISTIYLVPNSS